MLRVFAKVPGLLAALHLHLVETNPVLRQLQKQAVGAQLAQWHDRLEDVPHGPGIVIGRRWYVTAVAGHRIRRWPARAVKVQRYDIWVRELRSWMKRCVACSLRRASCEWTVTR